MHYNSLVKCTVRNDVDTIHIKTNVITEDEVDKENIKMKARLLIMEAENCPRSAIIYTKIISISSVY